MSYYFYDCDYDEGPLDSARLVFNANMYAVAEKYDVPLLKVLAKEKFSVALDKYDWRSLNSFVSATDVIYTNTVTSDRGLRDLIIPEVKANRAKVREHEGFRTLLSSGVGDGDFILHIFDALTI